MDPNAALAEALAALARFDFDAAPGDVENDDDARIIIERFAALNEWLSRGGFLPSKWAVAR